MRKVLLKEGKSYLQKKIALNYCNPNKIFNLQFKTFKNFKTKVKNLSTIILIL